VFSVTLEEQAFDAFARPEPIQTSQVGALLVVVGVSLVGLAVVVVVYVLTHRATGFDADAGAIVLAMAVGAALVAALFGTILMVVGIRRY
jgi:uncharacterized membrane protein YidH (DUF202 family)